MKVTLRRTSGKPVDETDKNGQTEKVVEIASLDDLAKLLGEYGECVIIGDPGMLSLEIYDDYRE